MQYWLESGVVVVQIIAKPNHIEAFIMSCHLDRRVTNIDCNVDHKVRQLLDNLLQEAAQRRLDTTLGTFGGIIAECSCLPCIGADGRLITRNFFPDVRFRNGMAQEFDLAVKIETPPWRLRHIIAMHTSFSLVRFRCG